MLKKKSSSAEKKRKHSQSEERHDSNKRRSAEANLEDSKDELADAELDRIGSDIEEGGLDLNLPFKPITAYAADRREMLEQCLRVLGEKKLRRMLPDELKQEQVLLGPAGKWSLHAGRRRGGCSSPCPKASRPAPTSVGTCTACPKRAVKGGREI